MGNSANMADVNDDRHAWLETAPVTRRRPLPASDLPRRPFRRTLEMKGYVSHRRGVGKTHVYFPVIDAETAGESVLERVLQKVYGDHRSSCSCNSSSSGPCLNLSLHVCARS